MKKFAVIIFIVFSFFCDFTFAQMVPPRKPTSQLKEIGLVGNVRSLRVTSHMAVDSFGTIYKGKKADYWRGDVVTNFDREGYKTDALYYDKEGKLNHKVVYRYSNTRKRTARETYGSDGKMSKRSVYLYDQKGNKIAFRGYNSQGAIFEVYAYKNNDKGQEIEEVCVQTEQSTCGKYTHEYDDAGRVSKLCRYVSTRSSKPDNCETYSYDAEGRMVEAILYQGERLIYKVVFEYDSSGNITTQTKYDRLGLMLDEVAYVYTYDKRGNWIERVEYVDGIARYMVLREVQYH
ncbi:MULTISPECIES: sugar-binding protein [Capnocytophaga]|uniref:sugar-binding protein n=1 Tax=Capnocytophaga TaxID=1016 RepID=UPI000BB19D5C|nr:MULTISPECIES: sugar-binding protein [Capnocytophaga]ATA75302.1 sugar-binding protein [Capnocytophaga sp. H2931]